nr:MAG TPA: hypothetical protein [Caudoviricetes sp.]DAS74254.1 MAG TPA: hypothetical protein [Caudoviricetes sp.]
MVNINFWVIISYMTGQSACATVLQTVTLYL